MKENSTIEQANQVVYDYVEFMLGRAMERAETERHGDGCGCPSCCREAVNDLNAWITWVSMGENPKYEYRYDPVRRMILRPEDIQDDIEGEDLEDTYD